MVGWVCYLISNSPQNVCLIRQFALLGFVGRKEGLRGGQLAHPQVGGGRCCGAAVDLFGGGPEDGLADFQGLLYISVTFKLGHKSEFASAPESLEAGLGGRLLMEEDHYHSN